MRFAVIVTAAGSSTRFNSNSRKTSKKEYLRLDGKSVLERSISPFLGIPGLSHIVVTYRNGDLREVGGLLSQMDFQGAKLLLVEGGDTRRESVFNGLKALYDLKNGCDIDIVCIHDGARPFVGRALVDKCIRTAERVGGACPCIKVSDTLVKVGKDGLLLEGLSREGVCTVQTPQVFRFPEIYLAHLAAEKTRVYTDDTGIYMDYGGKVAFVQGESSNRKITYASDLEGLQ